MNTLELSAPFRPAVVRGIIDRRILANYRCDPAFAARLLPSPFRPKLVGEDAIVGLCLLRLKQVGPTWWPEWAGLASENVAHRIAVEWDEGAHRREGVFVLRRETSSQLNALAGGRVFPGINHRADFEVQESMLRFKIAMRSRHDGTSVKLVARVEGGSLAGSAFGSVEAASQFFAAGSLGWSQAGEGEAFDGLELRTRSWRVTPLFVERIESSFWDDRTMFPAGTIAFDHALLMRNIPHEWHAKTWEASP